MTVGKRIMKERGARGYTRSQLAEKAKISEKFLYEIEMDKKGFSAMTLLNLSEALGVTLDYIMTGKIGRNCEEEIADTLDKFPPNTRGMVYQLLETVYKISQMKK